LRLVANPRALAVVLHRAVQPDGHETRAQVQEEEIRLAACAVRGAALEGRVQQDEPKEGDQGRERQEEVVLSVVDEPERVRVVDACKEREGYIGAVK